ncbi:hypothetical protein, partial [Vibrio barjaei]|uniref:hypothetical protein n=1 Tax=Vibrio barjaei TaxID=1676683 RepID=UPI00228509B6
MHNIYTVTDTESVYKAEGGYDVDVVCKLDFDNSLLTKLVNNEEDYCAGLANVSPVILRVFIANEYIKSESHLLLYAELLAIVQFMHIDGLNCFGVKAKLPTIYDVRFNVSSSDLSLLLSHDKFFINDLQDGKDSYLLGRCDPFLAYLYGANSAVISDCVLLDELRLIRETVESKSDRTRVSSGQVKSLLNLVTNYGVLTITFRTVVEYLNLPIHKEMQNEDGVN